MFFGEYKMALIIEDGSNVTNANSYATVVEIKAFAEARGFTLPTDDLEIEKLAIKATDYLESFRKRYQGTRTNTTQSLQWPRLGVVIDDIEYVEGDSIPVELKNAQMMATIEANKTDLLKNDKQALKKKKVDVIEYEYQDGTSSVSKGFSKVDVYLEPLLKAGGISLKSGRA